MTKSSEVLRLAAEYSLLPGIEKRNEPLECAYFKTCKDVFRSDIFDFADMVGYSDAKNGNETCMVLCLAAAIAESEGD